MNCTRLLCLLLVFAACAVTGNAGALLYTFGANLVSAPAVTPGTPDSLSSMNPASAGPATTVQTTTGDGSTGFNGGLVGVDGLLYAIGNDSNNVATLYSMTTAGLNVTAVSSGFNTGGDASGIVFMNGLAAAGSNFYAIGSGATEDLYQIGTGIAAGTATDIQTLNTFNGNFEGMAWDAALGEFYAVLDNINFGDFHGDWLAKFKIGGSVSLVASLTHLDGADVNTHLDGLADSGGGILYDIYINTTDDPGSGMLERIDVGGTPSATTLYDTQIQGTQNVGIAIVSPEPAATWEIGAGMILLCCLFRRAGIGRRFQTAAARCKR